MTVVGQPFQQKTSPTQQLSQTSWNESIPWAGDSTSVVEDGGPKIPVNLIIDVGKTPSVGPELSTTSGIEEGGSVLNEKTMIVSPQNSIVSINSINEFMSDKSGKCCRTYPVELLNKNPPPDPSNPGFKHFSRR